MVLIDFIDMQGILKTYRYDIKSVANIIVIALGEVHGNTRTQR